MEGKLIKFSSKGEMMWTAKLDDRDMEKNLNLSANTVKTQTQLKKHEVRNLLIIKTLLEGKELTGDLMKWFESTTTLKAVRKARTTITFHDGDDLLAIMDEHPNKPYKDLMKALKEQDSILMDIQ